MSEQAESNGTAPQVDEPCEDCATPGDKWLGVLVLALAAFVVIMGLDMITGGKVSGTIREQVSQ